MKSLSKYIIFESSKTITEPFERQPVGFKQYIKGDAEGTGKTEVIKQKVNEGRGMSHDFWFIVNNDLNLENGFKELFNQFADYDWNNHEYYYNVLIIPLANCIITINTKGRHATYVKKGDERSKRWNYKDHDNYLYLYVSVWEDYKTMTKYINTNTSKSLLEERILDKDLNKEYNDCLEDEESTDYKGEKYTHKTLSVKKFWSSASSYIPELVEDVYSILKKNVKKVRVPNISKSGKMDELACPYKLSTKTSLSKGIKTGKADIKNTEEGCRFFVNEVELDGMKYYIVYFIDPFDYYYNGNEANVVIMSSLGKLDKYLEWSYKPAKMKRNSELGPDGEIHVNYSAMKKSLPSELKSQVITDEKLSKQIIDKGAKVDFDKMMNSCYSYKKGKYWNHEEK